MHTYPQVAKTIVLFDRKGTPLIYLQNEFHLTFHLSSPLNTWMNQPLGASRYFKRPFLTPKCQFSLPFSKLELVNSLPFYIHPA